MVITQHFKGSQIALKKGKLKFTSKIRDYCSSFGGFQLPKKSWYYLATFPRANNFPEDTPAFLLPVFRYFVSLIFLLLLAPITFKL